MMLAIEAPALATDANTMKVFGTVRVLKVVSSRLVDGESGEF